MSLCISSCGLLWLGAEYIGHSQGFICVDCGGGGRVDSCTCWRRPVGNDTDAGYEERELAATFLPLRVSQGCHKAQGGTFCTSSYKVETAVEGVIESRLPRWVWSPLVTPQSPLYFSAALLAAVMNDPSEYSFTRCLHQWAIALARSCSPAQPGKQEAGSPVVKTETSLSQNASGPRLFCLIQLSLQLIVQEETPLNFNSGC